MNTEATKTVHEGRNVKRIREILGIKQEALAMELGLSQQAISSLEQREVLDKEMLEKVAKVLKVSPDVIKSFSDEAAFNIVGNTVHNHDNGALLNYFPTFNPFDKVVELYEALLKSEREKIVLLERMLDEKK